MHIKRTQMIAAVLLSGALFAGLTILRLHGSLSGMDAAAGTYASRLRSSGIVDMLAVLTEIFSIPVMSIVFVGMLGVLLFEPNKKPALYLLISVSLGVLLFGLLKIGIHASRPSGGLIEVAGWGFPSGHATLATVFFIFLAYLVEHATKSSWSHFLFNLIAVSMILAVSLSRIYLGLHWLSDVLAGILLGTFASSTTRMLLLSSGNISHIFPRKK
jgi:membrane-associated phospholipid phosphatase